MHSVLKCLWVLQVYISSIQKPPSPIVLQVYDDNTYVGSHDVELALRASLANINPTYPTISSTNDADVIVSIFYHFSSKLASSVIWSDNKF